MNGRELQDVKATNTADRPGEVSSVVERLTSAIKLLDSSVARLYERLGSVTAQPKEVAEEREPPEQSLVPLAERIRKETEMLDKIIRRLVWMYEQIEL